MVYGSDHFIPTGMGTLGQILLQKFLKANRHQNNPFTQGPARLMPYIYFTVISLEY